MTRVLGALGVRLVAEVVGSGKSDAVDTVTWTSTLVAKRVKKKTVTAKPRSRGKSALL